MGGEHGTTSHKYVRAILKYCHVGSRVGLIISVRGVGLQVWRSRVEIMASCATLIFPVILTALVLSTAAKT